MNSAMPDSKCSSACFLEPARYWLAIISSALGAKRVEHSSGHTSDKFPRSHT